MNEFEIISRYFAPLAGEGAFGLKDDVAVLPQRAGHDLIVTTDTVGEGTDFFAFDPAGSVAQKALRVNLSDLAAKGAMPAGYLLNLSLPHSVHDEWLAAFAAGLAADPQAFGFSVVGGGSGATRGPPSPAGLAADQQAFGFSLLGGDTGATEGPLSIAVTAFGFVPVGKMVKRGGARVGDAVYVTGTIGDSGGGLAIFRREKHTLNESQRDYLTARYRVPEPPVDFGAGLSGLASASADVSDGLIADLGHIADASQI